MFDTAFVMMDERARPVLLIPEDLPATDALLKIVDGGIDICVGEKTYGQVRGIADESLAMFGMQTAIGMATFKADGGEDLPQAIQYVAKVQETRLLK